MSTEDSRKAARDYWTSPRALRMATALDWTIGYSAAIALLLIGSLNL